MNVIKSLIATTFIATAFVAVQPVMMPWIIDTSAQAQGVSCVNGGSGRNSCHQAYMNSCRRLGYVGHCGFGGQRAGNGGGIQQRQIYRTMPMQGQQRVYRGQRHAYRGHQMVQGGAIAGGSYAAQQVVVQREPRYVPGPTEHAFKSPYQVISSDATGNTYEIPLD